jgi:hypothetical protein
VLCCAALRCGLACLIYHRKFLEQPAIHCEVVSQVVVSYATSGEAIRRVEETICFENHSGHQRNR